MAIIRINMVFARSCVKFVDPSTMTNQMEKITTTMCMLEKVFPPPLFNVMFHLPIHLVQQLIVCGPLPARWMYPVERYLKTFKGNIRQCVQPEGSMARGCIMDDALGFCTQYMQNCSVTACCVWDDTKEPSMNDKILKGNGIRRVLTTKLKIHDSCICDNNVEIL